MKKLFVSILALFVCLLAYTGIDAKQMKKCSWKGYVQTCKYGGPQSEWHTTINKYYNKKWMKKKQSTAHYPYGTPQKEVIYKYSKHNNLSKKTTNWYNIEGVSQGKKIIKTSETRYYKKRIITKKHVKKYSNNQVRKRDEVSTYKRGKLNKKVINTYNKKGQRKSNDNGNSYKYIRSYKKTKKGYKVTKEIKYKYNENGKPIKIK
ncbi:MAG: hypothetical protein RR425_05445 [Erysipelotrichales bacterium]